MNDMPVWIGQLPHLLALFNASAVVVLLGGLLAIHSKAIPIHRAFMTTALFISVCFLVVYAIYHAHVGNVKFAGEGTVRVFYFSLLASHVLLAVVNLPMVLVTAWRALKGRFESHRTLARYTVAVWLYVSLSGLVVYWMAFHRFAPQA